MKKIKQISFTEFILIPAKSKFGGSSHLSYCLKDPINNSNGMGSSASAYVLLFNCETVNEIPSIVELEIQTLQKKIESDSNKEILQSKLDFFSRLKKYLEDKSLRHDAPDDLLFIFSKTGCPRLKKDDVIFISGVASLVEG